MINEAFENDIRWGDSLLGRLISSALRVAKIGYQQTKVPKLLDQLKGELDNIVTQSFSKDVNEKYHELSIKSFMEEMKNCCLSSQSDVDKLRLLLGWDGQTPLWNEQDPKTAPNSAAGNLVDFVRRRPLNGIMNRIFDDIENDLPNLKEILGDSRDTLLDKLSDFTDELRKLTVDLANNQDSELRTFKKKFSTVLNGLAAVNDNFSFHKKYLNFVNESEEQKQIDNKQTGVVSTDGKNTTSDQNKNQNVSTTTPAKSGQVDQPQKVQNKNVSTTPPAKPDHVEEQPKNSASASNQKQIELLKIKGKELLDKIGDDEEDNDIKKLPEYGVVSKIVSSLSEESKRKIKNTEGGDNMLSTLDELFKTNKEQTTIQKNEVTKESIRPIFEELNQGDVENLWRDAWGDWDKKAIHKLSQREVDELNKMMDEGESMKAVDLSKRPDPLIAISRIFKGAHDLYFADVIPSGRKGGMVSNTTMRQYIYCGSGSRPSADRAGEYGPWLIKSIWNQWTDGVMKIIEDQTYRKILSKINFVIPGAEDSFNKGKKEGSNESFRFKINEAEAGRENIGTAGNKIEPRDKKSHGQILLDFMNDMIDQDQQADFSKSRRNLLKQYFGVIDSNAKNEDRPGGRKEDKVVGKLVWESKQLKRFTKDKNDNEYYYFKVKEDERENKKPNDPKTGIFFEVLKSTDDYVFIKFTMNQATAPNLLISNDPNFKGYKFENRSALESQNFVTLPVKNVFFGVLKNDIKDEISISYINLKEQNITVLGKPKTGLNYNFKIDPNSTKILYKSEPKEEVKIPDDLKIIKNGPLEKDSKDLLRYPNIDRKCIDQGKIWFGW